MQDDTTVPARRTRSGTRTRIAGAVSLAVTVAALVAGAVLIGGDTSPYEDAGARIERFYAERDAAGMLRAFAPGTVGTDQRETTRTTLDRILRPGVSVVDVSAPVDVAGVPIVRVTTADRIAWCVRPDGRILPGCRVGQLDVAVSGHPSLTAEVARIDLPLTGGPQLAVGLRTTGDEPLTLSGVRLTDAEGTSVPAELVQVAQVRDGQVVPGDPSAPTVAPGAQLFLGWILDGDPPANRTLRIAWDGGELTLDVRGTRWFVG